jgi:hypothetical protein
VPYRDMADVPYRVIWQMCHIEAYGRCAI